jgi:hypothetical protein
VPDRLQAYSQGVERSAEVVFVVVFVVVIVVIVVVVFVVVFTWVGVEAVLGFIGRGARYACSGA